MADDLQSMIDALRAPFGTQSNLEIPQGSLQGQVGATEIGKKVGNVIHGAQRAADAVDAANEDITHLGEEGYTPQMIAPVNDVTRQMAPMALPFAQQDAAGMFAGNLARGQDKDALQRAYQMVYKGAEPDVIWNETGHFADPTTMSWKHEISDRALWPLHENASGPASSMISHKDLFANYPKLRNYPVQSFYNEGPGGAFSRVNNKIEIGGSDLGELRQTAAHELQHAVQRLEGWPGGTDPSWVAKQAQIHNQFPGDPESIFAYLHPTVMKNPNIGKDIYLRSSGENEANNTLARLNFSDQQRRDTPPWATMKVPYSAQVIADPKQGYFYKLPPSDQWNGGDEAMRNYFIKLLAQK
jgi:hypothetical protein